MLARQRARGLRAGRSRDDSCRQRRGAPVARRAADLRPGVLVRRHSPFAAPAPHRRAPEALYGPVERAAADGVRAHQLQALLDHERRERLGHEPHRRARRAQFRSADRLSRDLHLHRRERSRAPRGVPRASTCTRRTSSRGISIAYKRYEYQKAPEWANVSDAELARFEAELGWHLLVRASLC